MIRLKIIITSTRPGRVGPHFARWIEDLAKANPAFDVEVIDLAEVNLPFMDEPEHPTKRLYTHEHTKAWSRRIDEADAFVIVAAEYNFGFTAVFKNAVDYLHHEWKNKPVGFVGYGGVAGGTRSIQMMKQVLTSVSMMPVVEAVYLPFFRQYFDAEGVFRPTDDHNKAAAAMLASVEKWAQALEPLRRS
jgi:NAD(P)H-dependent FMN reductase